MKKEIFLSIGYVLLIVFFKLFFHELWKDEWQAWMVARDMPLTKMLSFLNYEGHPSLWYLYLKPFTWLSSFFNEAFLLNLAHTIPIIICSYLFFVRTSLPFFFKILVGLSYFFCFEYGVINRGYIWVFLFTFLATISIKENRILLFSISLFFLSQTEVFGVFIASTLLYYYFDINGIKNLKPFVWFAIGLMVFTITVYPRFSDSDFSQAFNQLSFSLTSVGNSIQGLLANTFAIGIIPDTATYGYNSLGLLISAIIFVCVIYLLYPIKLARNQWILGFGMLLTFSIFIFRGGVRQWGLLYLLFITLLILHPSIYAQKAKFWLIVLLLTPPVIHNCLALSKDLQINFSNSKDAGNFIKNKIPENVAIVSLNKFETVGAAAYANRRFFEMPSGNTFTYFKWLEKIYVPTQSELMLFAKYKGAKGLIVISSSPIDTKRFPILKLWKKFDEVNFKSEEYYFYTLNLSGRN